MRFEQAWLLAVDDICIKRIWLEETGIMFVTIAPTSQIYYVKIRLEPGKR